MKTIKSMLSIFVSGITWWFLFFVLCLAQVCIVLWALGAFITSELDKEEGDRLVEDCQSMKKKFEKIF